MQVYQTDENGFFVGAISATESPLEMGQTPPVYLIPEGAKLTAPPTLLAGQRAQWVGNDWVVVDPDPVVAPPPFVPTTEHVTWERFRRIEAGVTVSVTGAGDIPLQGRPQDLQALHGLATAASLRLSIGDTAHVTMFRDAADVIHNLVPAQVIEMWSLGAAWVESVYAAGWAIKDEAVQSGTPIPDDYADDSRWP